MCDDDLTFPYMTSREITIGAVPVVANRVTYVGEMGWELYCSAEYTDTLWDTLIAAGAPHGLVPGGYRAIDSLRLEKGYRVWGTDITSDTDPHSAGLGFAVRSRRQFVGRDALEARAGGSSRLACLVLEDPRSVALGNEPVATPAGVIVGRVSSGGPGYALAVSIAYAWLPVDHAAHGTRLAVEVFGEQVGAEVRPEPLYDPRGERGPAPSSRCRGVACTESVHQISPPTRVGRRRRGAHRLRGLTGAALAFLAWQRSSPAGR